MIIICCGKKIRFPPRILESRSFKNFNAEEFTKDLASQDWSELYHTSDVNECAKIFTGNILQADDKHAPKRTIRVKGTVQNMFSDELIALMKERDRARLKAVTSQKEEDWSVFKKLRNKVNNTKNKEKKDYFKDQIENAKDSKEMWKTLKELVPSRSKKAVEVKRVLNNGKEETDPRKIANVFNDFFGGIAAKLAEKFKKNDKIENLKKRTNESFKFKATTARKVSEITMRLKMASPQGWMESASGY